MPLSLLDMPAVRAAVSDFHRILEHPTPTNETARRIFKWATTRTTLGGQKVPVALIQAGIEWVLFHFGDHIKRDCPEITDSQLDLTTKAALLDLRGELLPPIASYTLATDAGTRVRFLVFLADVLARTTPASADAGNHWSEAQKPPAAVRAAEIDTTPTVPKAPAGHIEAAARAIPGILANIPPGYDGTIELVAAHLAKRLQDARHSLAAALWSIHEAIQAGRLRAGLVEVELPSVGVPSGSWGGPAHQWHGGERGTKAIAKGKPASFDCFKVVATEALWEWWRSLDAAESAEMETEATYTPCDREPRTYAELVRWMVYWADFRNPRRTGLRPPTIANNPDHIYLESYCKEMFGSFDLDALGRLRTRYIVQTSRTVEEIDATTLRDLADHFRRLTCQASAGEQRTGGSGDGRADAGTTESAAGRSAKKPKQSTERGEGRTKLIGALTKHHQYADGSCLNLDPIGNNELAKLADVSPSTASAFFNNEFQGHSKYKALCRDSGRLAAALELLNNEFSPHNLYGGRPADEGDEGNLK